MKLDLSDIIRMPGSYAEHDIDMTFKEIEGMTLTVPVRGKLTVSSTGLVLLLEGYVDTEVEQVCFRCGVVYSQPVHAEFQEDFVITRPQASGQAIQVEEEEAPESRLFIEGTMDLNLDELIRQSILVALPLKPLCDEGCKGLCPRCGQRLSEGACACPAEAPSTVMAELLRSLERRKGR